ncbi:hypothetical protein L7F22_036907 [Adiantum nelumboides]|nr:hypothetical protein [Adiantum nelumboides]
MLQQAPESKSLPLHSLHGRRLSTKIFDSSAPDTSYVPPTTFTKTEHSNATLAPPVVHRGMYYGDHQALNHGKPVELATTLWPPESTNYWFPNWKELFHGFLVVQKGQTRQALVADSEQRESNLYTQQQNSGCSPQCFNTQFVHLSSDNANTSIPWVPLCQQSQHHLPKYTNVYQQKSGSPPRCSTTQSVRLGFGNTIPSVHRAPLSQQSQQHHLQLYNNNATQASLPISIPYHNGSHLPAERQEKAQAQIGEANKACSSSIQAPGMNNHCTMKSPLWLPQGWITEIQMRTTGSAAGTHNKYFKHLASGRRFRSRKDVLHFTSTGKGRAKKKSRGNKLQIHSAGHSLLKTFAHRKLSILEHSKPFSHSSSDDKHSTYVASSLLLRLSEPGVTDELGLPCKRLNSLCSSDGNQLPAEEYAKHKPHELPVQKKAKALPSETGEDKQASKLCEWLTKPVARSTCSTLNQEVLPVSFRPDVEKAATETADERSVKDLSLRTQTSHRVNQLSKEIQEAQDNMVQMSREVQAAAEKLSREILAAKKDVEFGQDLQVVQVPTESFRVLADKSQDKERCKPKNETFSRSLMTSSIGDLVCKPGGATNGLLKPAHFTDFLNTSVICGIPALGLDHTSGVVIQPVTCMPETCPSLQLHVNKPTTWLNVIEHPEVQMVKTAHALKEVKTTHRDGLNHGKRQAQTALVESLQKHAVPAVISYQTERSPLTKGDLKQPALWAEVPTIQTQKLLPIASGSITKAVDAYASTYCEVEQPVDNVTTRTYITWSHVLVTSHHSEQPGEVAEPNDARAIRRQTRSMDPPAQTPVTSREQAPLSHGICANASVKSNAGSMDQLDIWSSGAQQWIGTQETSESRQGVKYQQIDEIEARRLRRRKFSAVLNPKLDLSRLSPLLTTRQKAKVVEKMKARHARELLATLGKNICRKAVRRKL